MDIKITFQKDTNFQCHWYHEQHFSKQFTSSKNANIFFKVFAYNVLKYFHVIVNNDPYELSIVNISNKSTKK